MCHHVQWKDEGRRVLGVPLGAPLGLAATSSSAGSERLRLCSVCGNGFAEVWAVVSASVRSNECWELGVRLCSSAMGTRAACKLQPPLFPRFFKSAPGSPITLRSFSVPVVIVNVLPKPEMHLTSSVCRGVKKRKEWGRKSFRSDAFYPQIC